MSSSDDSDHDDDVGATATAGRVARLRAVTTEYRNRYFLFSGDSSDGRPSGYGVLHLHDGGMIEGMFDAKGELNCHRGCRRWADGTSVSGPLRRGEPHGPGCRYVALNGDEYEGDYSYGVWHGTGTFSNRALGVSYSGEFNKRQYHGRGTLSTRQMRVEGQFDRGVPHGDCRIEYANGDTYNGSVNRQRPVNGEFFAAHAVPPMRYSGAFSATGERAELPDCLRVVDVRVAGCTNLSSAIDALAASRSKLAAFVRKKVIKEKTFTESAKSDGIITVPVNAPVTITIELARQVWQAPPVVKGKTPPPASKKVLVSTESCRCESGRPSSVTLLAGSDIDRALSLRKVVRLLLGENDPLFVAATLRNAAAAKKKPGLELPPLPSPSNRGLRTSSPQHASSRSASPATAPLLAPHDVVTESSGAASSVESLQSDERITATFVNGLCEFTIHPMTLDQGEYVLHISTPECAIQMRPGPDGAVATCPSLSASLRVKLVQ